MSTASTPPDPVDHTRDDLIFAWSSALNIRLPEDTPADPGAVRQALRSQPRVRAHVDLLLSRLHADPARLAAIPGAAHRRISELQAGGAEVGQLRCFLIAAELAEQALARVRHAGAESDPQAQRDLADAVMADWFPTPEPFRPGLFDRHRFPRRFLRRFDPRWWYRRWQLRTALLEHRPADAPDDVVSITVVWHGQRIATIGYLICHSCRQAQVAKVSVDTRYHNLGLGRRLVLTAHAAGPDYEWTTTPQYDTAERFWQRMARTTGARGGYRDDLLTPTTRCRHMHPDRRLDPLA